MCIMHSILLAVRDRFLLKSKRIKNLASSSRALAHKILCISDCFGMINTSAEKGKNPCRCGFVSGRILFKAVQMGNATSPGLKLRALRTERKLSQRALAQLAGISPNSVSLIEREEISPSVATLQTLATALEVRMSYFFEDETDQNILYIKSDQRPSLNSQGVNIQSIGGRLHNQEMEPFLIRLASNTSSGERQVIHTGHEVVYCLNGKFEYLIDGQSFMIENGDFLLFEASLPHLWRNPFDEPAEFILILQTPGAKLDPVKRHFVDYPSIPHIG
jgi:transcriptional regulator with XRE-family HTH domain